MCESLRYCISECACAHAPGMHVCKVGVRGMSRKVLVCVIACVLTFTAAALLNKPSSHLDVKVYSVFDYF